MTLRWRCRRTVMSDPQNSQIHTITRKLAAELKVCGLMNVQYAVKGSTVYVLEVNPRASRTVPFVSKATEFRWAKIASRLMVGEKLSDFNLPDELPVNRFYVKTPVFPFAKFQGVDPILGPEMKSTGEVMGIAEGFGAAFLKAMAGAGTTLPKGGTAFISVNDHDKTQVAALARRLVELGFKILATRGTVKILKREEVPVEMVYKVNEGRPNVVDLIKSGKIHLIINTPLGRASFYDEQSIRRAAMQYSVPSITTMTGANAATKAIEAIQSEVLEVRSLQEYHEANDR